MGIDSLYLEESIGKRRYEHSLRVADTALELAGKIDFNQKEELYLASLLHDCGKFLDRTRLIEGVKKYGLEDHEYFKNNIQLIHGPLGGALARDYYGIEDEDILNAIVYHTTGRDPMTILEKLVFLADYIEPARSFDGLKEVRILSYKGHIDEAMLLALDQNIRYILGLKKYLAVDTIRSRNHLIKIIGK